MSRVRVRVPHQLLSFDVRQTSEFVAIHEAFRGLSVREFLWLDSRFEALADFGSDLSMTLLTHQTTLALLEAAATSSNDGPRQVLADWFDDHGEPWGEFIRLQCARSEQQAPSQREHELRRLHADRWVGAAHHSLMRCEFHRGLPTGRFGHSGLFVTAEGHEAMPMLRFYPDGLVLRETTLQTVDLQGVSKWFDREVATYRGTYRAEWSWCGIKLAFTIDTPFPQTFTGTLNGGVFDATNLVDEAKPPMIATYQLVSAPSCDTR